MRPFVSQPRPRTQSGDPIDQLDPIRPAEPTTRGLGFAAPTPGPTAGQTADGWLVVEESFEPARQHGQETIFTVGNGLLGTRGSLEEGYPADRPATLVHGLFDAHPLARSELANAPDWTDLEVLLDGERLSLDRGEVLEHRRALDLRTGLLERRLRWRSPAGRTAELVFERFASLADRHLLAQRLTVTPLDFDGPVAVRAGLDGCPETDGLVHWDVLASAAEDDRAWLELRTRQRPNRLGLAVRLAPARREGVDDAPAGGVEAWDAPGHPRVVRRWLGEAGRPVSVEKVVAVATSREGVEPGVTARARLSAVLNAGRGFDDLFASSAAAWAEEWAAADIEIEGDPAAQLAVRFSLFQLLIAAPREDERASIGAKALTGFGYKGHAFWDTETFMLPFFSHVRPALARDLLSYRWHHLDGARRKAAATGLAGARFPWESDDGGDEVTPSWLPHWSDPSRLVRIWTGDIELHVSADIAYAVCQYWRASGDERFMVERGAEIVLETARFWASRAEWDEADARFHYRDVIGPDEYHEHVDDNAFTNAMVAWNLQAAARVARWLRAEHPADADRLLAADAEPDGWERVADLIHQPVDPATGLREQFAGYFDRRDVDPTALEGRTRSIQAVLGIEETDRTQALKQPDVLMLALLLPDLLDGPALAANDAYYTPRTDHAFGSSLGPAIQAVVAARLGRTAEAYEHFRRAAEADLVDVRGNAGDGIHAASTGGIWQAVVFGFGGLRLDGDPADGPTAGWRLEPHLPAHWTRLAFRFHHAGRLETVELRQPAGAAGALTTPAAVAVAAGRPATGGVRGLIFDLDGVLTDTAEAHYRAWQRLADEEGLAFDRAANEALRGVSRRGSLDRLLAGRPVDEPAAEALMARKNGYYLELVGEMTPADALPGAVELLAAARAAGLRVALASASLNARLVMERLGLLDAVDVLCDGRTVERGKPAPDLFLHAAARLGLAPADCLVFEDAATGIEAAHAAGMRAIGIGPAERVGEAELVLPDGFAGSSLAGILGALERGASERDAGAGVQGDEDGEPATEAA